MNADIVCVSPPAFRRDRLRGCVPKSEARNVETGSDGEERETNFPLPRRRLPRLSSFPPFSLFRFACLLPCSDGASTSSNCVPERERERKGERTNRSFVDSPSASLSLRLGGGRG